MARDRYPSRMMRAPFVLVYLIPALVLIHRYWPWDTANVPDATFIAIGLGGLAILATLSVFLLPRLVVSLGAKKQTARGWQYAAGDAVIVPLLLVSYLSASKLIHSFGAFLVAAAVLTVVVVMGANIIQRRAFPDS